MPTPKNAIKEALEQLDQKNDALWTDDGSPVIAEVQRLCNDDKLTRAQINDALPGFARKTATTSIDEETQAPVPGAVEAAAAPAAPLDEELEDMLRSEPEEGTYDDLRIISTRHVADAELALQEARLKVSEAQRYALLCEKALTRKIMLHHSKFPAISEAQNIKDHLARQQEILYEKVTGNKMPTAVLQNPIDARMADRGRPNGRNAQSRAQAPAPFLPRKSAVNY